MRLTDDPACPQQPASLSNSETNSQTTLLQQSSLSSMASLPTMTTNPSGGVLGGIMTAAPSSGNPSLLSADDSSTTSLIDGDASIQPICTQPESGVVPRSNNAQQTTNAHTAIGLGTNNYNSNNPTNTITTSAVHLPGTPTHSSAT